MSTVDPETLYEALRADASRLGGLRRLRYWCLSRCLLLDAVAVADTILLHQKRFKNSHEVNQRRSNAAGRAKNTFDGDKHWMPSTYYITSSALGYPQDSGSRQALQCDHVGVLSGAAEDLTLSAVDFHADWEAGHAEVIIRRDGSRYPVE